MSLKSICLVVSFMLIATTGVASAQEGGHSVQWCSASVTVDGALWQVHSAKFRNVRPPGNASMYDAGKERIYADEWKEFLADNYQTRDWIPHSCGGYVLDWSSGSALPYSTEAAALSSATKARSGYRKSMDADGKPKYAGMIELDWLPAGAERMGAPTGEKRTPNPDVRKK
jgi:hypothetical protein